MQGYTTPLSELAKVFKSKEGSNADPSLDLIKYLALAYEAANRLEDIAGPLEFRNQELIKPALERAHREALHVRTKNMPNGFPFDTTTITKFGRLTRGPKS